MEEIMTMKNMLIRMGGISLMLLLAGGCWEETKVSTRTRILPDGSCERVFQVTSDSEQLKDCPFPIPTDASWTISREKREEAEGKEKNTRYVYTAKRRFASVAKMARILEEDTDPMTLRVQPRIRFQKKWRGFFINYRYRETIPVLEPYRRIPAVRFFSAGELKEIRKLVQEDKDEKDSLSKAEQEELEAKAADWMRRSLFEDFFPLLLVEVKRLNDPELTVETVYQEKNRFYSLLNDDFPNIEKTVRRWEKEMKMPVFGRLLANAHEVFDRYQKKLDMAEGLWGYEYTLQVSMPGIISATNSSEIKGNIVSWSVNPLLLMFEESEMTVESRRVNRWMIWISALLVLLVFLALVVLFWLRRRR